MHYWHLFCKPFCLIFLRTCYLLLYVVSEVALGYLLDAEKRFLGDQIKFHQREMLHNLWFYPKMGLLPSALVLDRRSIDLSGAQEKEGNFHYKNLLGASKWGITCHTCSIIPKSLYWGLGLIPILSKEISRWWSRYGMWYLILKLLKRF